MNSTRSRHSVPDGDGRLRKRGRVLGFIGAKGGVGTTTVAINVACALAQRKNTVIAAELRPCWGTFAHHFRPHPPAPHLAGLLEVPAESIYEAARHTPLPNFAPGVRVLFGPQKVEECKQIQPHHAQTIIQALATLADYVVLDLPCAPSDANRAAVRLCDFVGLVLEREPTCLASAKLTLELLRLWSQSQVLIGKVVVNRCPLECPVELNEIAFQLGGGTVGVLPPAADVCLMAQKSGEPVILSQPGSLLAGSLIELAAKLATAPIVVAKPF